MAVIAAALIATAGAALNAKVAKNRANNPQDTVTAKAAGAGQAGGVPIDIEDIVGTEVSGEGITPLHINLTMKLLVKNQLKMKLELY